MCVKHIKTDPCVRQEPVPVHSIAVTDAIFLPAAAAAAAVARKYQ